MRTIQKKIGLIVFFLIVITCGCFKAYAAPPTPDGIDIKTVYASEIVFRSGDFLCFLIQNRVCIVGYYGYEENLVIPDEIDGHIVEGIIGLSRVAPVKTITVGNKFGELYIDGLVQMSSFWSIDELEEIRVSKENKNFCSKKGVLYSKDMKILYAVPPSIKQSAYTVPQSVMEMHFNDPFRNNKTLKEVRFKKNTSIKGIGGAFNNLENLEIVSLRGITESINYCFYDCPKLKKIVFDSKLKAINSSFYFLDSLQDVTLPSNLRTMGDQGSFVQCLGLEKAIIPGKVNYISGGSFYKDEGSVEMVMPSYIKSKIQQGDMTGYYASIVLGERITNIRGLKSIKVTLPKSTLITGEKQKIVLQGKCKDYIITDEDEWKYTGKTIKGNVAEECLESGLFSFKSDHPEIVSVSKNGELTAVSSGTAIITIKCVPKPKVKYSFKVIVEGT